MAITGVYSNGVIKTKTKLKENQRVIITPVKESAFGILNKYANPEFIPMEKDVIEDEFVNKYISKENNS